MLQQKAHRPEQGRMVSVMFFLLLLRQRPEVGAACDLFPGCSSGHSFLPCRSSLVCELTSDNLPKDQDVAQDSGAPNLYSAHVLVGWKLIFLCGQGARIGSASHIASLSLWSLNFATSLRTCWFLAHGRATR